MSGSFVSVGPEKTGQSGHPVRIWFVLGSAALLCLNVLAFAGWVGQTSGRPYSARIELVKVLTIGDEASEDGIIFGEISELVAVDSRGRIFVGDQQASQIYTFTSEGELIASIGNESQGPGEFALLADVRTGSGDTLYAFDMRNGRISAFDPSILDFAYSFAVARDTGDRPARDLVGVLEVGFVVTYEDVPFPGTDFATERFKYAEGCTLARAGK